MKKLSLLLIPVLILIIGCSMQNSTKEINKQTDNAKLEQEGFIEDEDVYGNKILINKANIDYNLLSELRKIGKIFCGDGVCDLDESEECIDCTFHSHCVQDDLYCLSGRWSKQICDAYYSCENKTWKVKSIDYYEALNNATSNIHAKESAETRLRILESYVYTKEPPKRYYSYEEVISSLCYTSLEEYVYDPNYQEYFQQCWDSFFEDVPEEAYYDEEYFEQSIPSTQKEETTETAIVKDKPKYDFPELQLNKKDVYSLFNSNQLMTNGLKEYDSIGLVVDGKKFNLIVTNGKVVDMNKDPMENDFEIKTTIEELKEIIQLTKTGTVKEIALKLKSLDMPLYVKLKIVKSLALK